MNNRSQLPYRTFPAALASLALSATATIALAQSQQDDMDYDESSDTLEEIVVTAQRREENLKDVPIAITALDASQMERLGIGNINDLQPYVPNLVLSRNTGTANGARIYLRGVGEDESRATVEPGIPLYIDGVYYGRAIGSLVDLLDVEQMEVLRGPQGTLYGRNSNGGAIRLQTRAPDSDKFHAHVGGTIGSYALTDIKASANIPVSDNGGLRLSFLSRTRDGIFETTDAPEMTTASGMTIPAVTAGEDIGAYDVTSYRLTYKHDTDNLKVTVSADGVTDNSEPRPPNALPDNADDVYELAGGYNVNEFYKSNVESSGFSAAVEWQSGDFTFRSLTASRSLQDDLQTVIAFPYTQETDQSQFSEELQVVSNWDSDFNFVAGLFIFQEDINLPGAYAAFPFDLTVDTSATAVFGQGTYDLNEQLRLTFGLRSTSESKSFQGDAGGGLFTRDQDRDWSHSTHKLAANYDIDDSSSIYVSNSSGFRSGAWSPDAFGPTATFLPVDEETVTTTEFGYRGLLSDDKLRLYATYFLSDYDDLQLSGTTSAGFTRFNISAAEISGLEIELTALLMSNLQLRATLATLDAKFTDLDADGAIGLGALAPADLLPQAADVPEGVLPDKPGELAEDATDDQKAMHEAATKAYNDAVASDPTAIAAIAPRVAEGIALGLTRRLKNTPESSFTLGLFYEKQIGSGLELNLSGDLANEAESYSLSANPDDLKREATTLLNLRVGVSKPEVWDAAFWIKNATDEVYYPAAVSALGGSVYAADPMTWGIDFRYRF